MCGQCVPPALLMLLILLSLMFFLCCLVVYERNLRVETDVVVIVMVVSCRPTSARQKKLPAR